MAQKKGVKGATRTQLYHGLKLSAAQAFEIELDYRVHFARRYGRAFVPKEAEQSAKKYLRENGFEI